MIDEDRTTWTLAQLADEVIEACELPMGCRATIIAALHDAKAQGRAEKSLPGVRTEPDKGWVLIGEPFRGRDLRVGPTVAEMALKSIPTPRTDALATGVLRIEDAVALCEELERELVIRTNERDRAEDAVESMYAHICGSPLPPNHASDCAVHNEPALPKGECDCGAVGNQSRNET